MIGIRYEPKTTGPTGAEWLLNRCIVLGCRMPTLWNIRFSGDGVSYTINHYSCWAHSFLLFGVEDRRFREQFPHYAVHRKGRDFHV